MAIPNFKLSKYFSFYEMTETNYAEFALKNREEAVQFVCPMTHFLGEIIDPLREAVGPLGVSSGYRCSGLNTAVGGSPTSQHTRGTAVDFWMPNWNWPTVTAIGPVMAKALQALSLKGKIIMEKTNSSNWIHVSRGPELSLWTGINGVYTRMTW